MTSVRRRFNRQPLRGNGPACLCQVSTPDALIERKAIGQAPLFSGLAIVLNEAPRAPVTRMPLRRPAGASRLQWRLQQGKNGRAST